MSLSSCSPVSELQQDIIMRVNKSGGGKYHVESLCGDVWTSIDHKLTNGPDIVNIVGLR